MVFTKSGLLLNNEAYMIESCITHGLTALRNSHVGEMGTYYSAFFQLSIGLERLMKITLIIDHMASNNLAAPTQRELKDYGHDLLKLFDKAHSITCTSSPHPLNSVATGSIEHDILTFLAEFAETSGRYFNLDQLSTGKSGQDPLARWKQILLRILCEQVSTRTKNKIDRESKPFASARASKLITVMGHDLDGQSLTTVDAASIGARYLAAASYAVFHVIGIVLPLRELLAEISTPATYWPGSKEFPVPDMSRFLEFALMERRDILRKRRWP